MNRYLSKFTTPIAADAVAIGHANVVVTSDGNLGVDASEASLAPGEWPQTVIVVDENGIPMTERFRRQRNVHNRSVGLIAVEYVNDLGTLLTIANT